MNHFSTLLLNNPAAAASTPALQSGSAKAVAPIEPVSGVNVDNFQSIIDNVIPELTAENIALLQNTGNILPNSATNTSLLQAQAQTQTQNLPSTALSPSSVSSEILLDANKASGNILPTNNTQQTNIVNSLEISDAITKLGLSNDVATKIANADSLQKLNDGAAANYAKKAFSSNELASTDPLKEQSLKQIFSRLPQNYSGNNSSTNLDTSAQKLVPLENGNILGQSQPIKSIQPNGEIATKQLNSISTGQPTPDTNILASIAKETNPDVQARSNQNLPNQVTSNNNNLSNTAVPNVATNPSLNNKDNSISTYKPNLTSNNNSDFVSIQNSLNTATTEDVDFRNQAVDSEGKVIQQITSDNKTDQINSKSAEARPYTSASEQISLKINKAIKNNDTKVEIQLDPAKLGKVSVNIELAKEGKSTVVIMVEKAETLELLKADSKTLERALQNAGINADSGSLEFGLKGQNKQFASYNQNNSSNNSNGNAEQEELDNINNSNNYNNYQSDRALDIRA